jgi:hypothetical protein
MRDLAVVLGLGWFGHCNVCSSLWRDYLDIKLVQLLLTSASHHNATTSLLACQVVGLSCVGSHVSFVCCLSYGEKVLA